MKRLKFLATLCILCLMSFQMFSQTYTVQTDVGDETTNFITKWESAGTHKIKNSLIFDNGTNVGIGTTSPTEVLEVNGDILGDTYRVLAGEGNGIKLWNSINYMIKMGNSANYQYGEIDSYSIKTTMFDDPSYTRGWTWGSYNTVPIASLTTKGTLQLKKNLYVIEDVGIGTTNCEGKLTIAGETYKSHFCYGADEDTYIRPGKSTGEVIMDYGSLCIGTSDPGSYLLAVDGDAGFDGTIECEELIVTPVALADYVFKDDYSLKTLTEVDNFIKLNGHLPNVPSAKDVEENGMQVGAMVNTLLEKIEELTLYMIELKKENQEIKAKLSSITNQQ